MTNDTQAETIAELMAERAKVAALREALKLAEWAIKDCDPETDPNGFAYAILEVSGALAATDGAKVGE